MLESQGLVPSTDLPCRHRPDLAREGPQVSPASLLEATGIETAPLACAVVDASMRPAPVQTV